MGHPTTSALPGEFPIFTPFFLICPPGCRSGVAYLKRVVPILDHKVMRHYLSLLHLPSATTVGHGIMMFLTLAFANKNQSLQFGNQKTVRFR